MLDYIAQMVGICILRLPSRRAEPDLSGELVEITIFPVGRIEYILQRGVKTRTRCINIKAEELWLPPYGFRQAHWRLDANCRDVEL
jgi:hypothetical protein